MLVSIIITIITPLALGVVWLTDLYSREFSWQKTQIVLDNTAIQLGRRDLRVIRNMEYDVRKLKALHKRFHQSLFCSTIPATAIHCLKTANALRLLIKGTHLESRQKANNDWQRAGLEAQKELNQANLGLRLERNSPLLLEQKRCSICLEVHGWKLKSLAQTKTSLSEINERHLSTSVSIETDGFNNWNYRLWEN